MRLQRLLFLVLCTLASSVLAEKVCLTRFSPQFCTSMYSKQDWDGDIEPHIEVNLQYFKSGDDNVHSSLSVVIFEYSDMDALGVKVSDYSTHYLCSEQLVDQGLCDTSELHQFIVNKNVTPKAEVLSSVLTSYGDNGLQYKILKTGYYCVACSSPHGLGKSPNRYLLQVDFQNSFGSLPAAEIPKLKFHGLLAVLYAVSLFVYLFQLFMHRSEILVIQKSLAWLLAYLTLESIFTWSFFAFVNHNKTNLLHPTGDEIMFYQICVSLLSAFKIPSALVLLVLISAGYEIVFPKSNGKPAKTVRLACAIGFSNLLAGVLFFAFSCFTVSQPQSGPAGRGFEGDDYEMGLWFLGIVRAISSVICYYMALSALWEIKKLLAEDKQHAKLKLYQRLFWVLSISALLMISTAIILIMLKINNSFTALKTLSSLFDFCSSCLFFAVFTCVVFLFRPSHELYLWACRNKVPENEFSEEPHVVASGGEIEFDDLDEQENAQLMSSSGNPLGDTLEFDLNREHHKGEHAQISSPPPSYSEVQNDGSEGLDFS
ncbi:unnamed protein product [Kuraishia capsulata CBS 1993]|uniref:Intimal thickness related receptor IRP domain-containing protein n=1 Tax=Kuraishia capsulata CBS 1993 TaxID=1382522 RepID=W6MXE5_9ASCO|nr:uncharacterized protein KUCA_T00004734001 [Kuraishia capsulata CBS 1993]CDK28750.1 unnamed protein product [Kuraishia capsulata CBS 1993]